MQAIPTDNRRRVRCSRTVAPRVPLPLVLFLSSQGKQRSRTAYDLCARETAYWPHWSFAFGGVAASPYMPVDPHDVERARMIVVMERKHIFQLRSHCPQIQIDETRLVCLDIPDEYEYFDGDLVQILHERLHPLLKRSA